MGSTPYSINGTLWKVAKLSSNQLLDVRPEDVLNDGWFRKCETYRGGGGYDKFPIITEKRFGKPYHVQFIAQLYGCNLDCPYCYVTREGVWGEFKEFTTYQLMKHFFKASVDEGCDVFHLMGGAPALQLKKWPTLIALLEEYKLFEDRIFHSDLMLTEQLYDRDILKQISHPRALYAVDIKGLDEQEHLTNTRKPFQPARFWTNLRSLEEVGVPYYITFTNISEVNQAAFWRGFATLYPETYKQRKEESFQINLIDYDALPYVDSRPWGAVKDKNNG